MALLQEIDGSKKISLKDFDPDSHGGIDKETARAKELELEKELSELQELVYAAQQTPVLIVLQGLDTSGKDGTIRHAMSSMQGVAARARQRVPQSAASGPASPPLPPPFPVPASSES